MALGRCSSCRGFIAKNSRTCPHCGDSVRTVVGAIGAVGSVLAAGAVAVTLMACYGCPDCMDNEVTCPDGTMAYDSSQCISDAGGDRDLPDVTIGDEAINTFDASSDDAETSDAAGDADIADASDDGG